jgi:hypothetical protein
MDTDMTRAALEQAVLAAMESAAAAPMVWGKDDCTLWCANIVRDAMGYDPAARFRGRYRTRRGANRALGNAGLLNAVRASARRHGWQRIPPALAQVGDGGMVWVQMGGRQVLATVICRARGWFVGRTERGFSAVAAERVAVAWSVLPDALSQGPGPRVSLGSWRPHKQGTTAVAHEPISAAIGLTDLIVGIFSTSAAVAGAIGGGIVSATIGIVLSVGVSLVASLLRPSTGASIAAPDAVAGDSSTVLGGTSDVSAASSAQFTERQSVPFKRVIVGRTYVGGALFFEQVSPPYLTQGVLINHGPIDGIEKVFIGTDELAFTTISPNTIMTPVAVDGQPDYPGHLRVSLRYGSATQATDPLILARYPNVGATFQQLGIATAVYEYNFGTNQADFIATWGNVSRPTAFTVARGVVVYDPRDPTQSLTDETTWKWSNNATLVQAWYLTRAFGGRIPKASIRWDKIATSANWDDTLMGCNDGTLIAKHTIDGVITLSQQPFAVMQDFLTANRGMVLESGGSMWIESSQPKTSIVTIHDRILAGGITYQAGPQKADLVNKLQVRFVSPDQDYQIVDGPILSRTDLQTADGEVLTATLALNYTTDQRRAQRLQKCFLESSRLGRTLQITVNLSLMATAAINSADELVGSVVTFNSQLFSNANGDYMVTAVGFADDCTTLSLALAQYDPTIETNWNPETDEQPFVLADINLS